MARQYTIVLVPELEAGGYTVLVPALPGCVTHGRTVPEAVERARDAIAVYIESLEAHGESVPEEREQPRTQHVDLVGQAHGGEAVGDDDRRAGAARRPDEARRAAEQTRDGKSVCHGQNLPGKAVLLYSCRSVPKGSNCRSYGTAGGINMLG
ncbi:MAG: type II toxin-antitoxin system HicB family antitoxin [Chloroflexi bacterium]|nr:type II toxin-antitoxin system HicB family antitoxin [Chloroflexota bacterium]